MQKENINEFILANAYPVYSYINNYILKDVGIMNKDYFIKLIHNVFVENKESLDSNVYNNTNLVPYVLFTCAFNTGIIAYTSLRNETINFDVINKEAKAYYNYVQFRLNGDDFEIALMQSKIGGMPIDEDIVKYLKKIPVDTQALQNTISSNEQKNKDDYEYITKGVQKVLG